MPAAIVISEPREVECDGDAAFVSEHFGLLFSTHWLALGLWIKSHPLEKEVSFNKE